MLLTCRSLWGDEDTSKGLMDKRRDEFWEHPSLDSGGAGALVGAVELSGFRGFGGGVVWAFAVFGAIADSGGCAVLRSVSVALGLLFFFVGGGGWVQ